MRYTNGISLVKFREPDAVKLPTRKNHADKSLDQTLGPGNALETRFIVPTSGASVAVLQLLKSGSNRRALCGAPTVVNEATSLGSEPAT